MKIEYDKKPMTIVKFNPRSELNGTERKPAGDLLLDVATSNDDLAMIHGSLKSLLYYFDSARPADLADQGKKDEKGYAPHLRMPKLKGPLHWDEDQGSTTLTIHHGIGGKSDIVLEGCKVNIVSIDPREGGTVLLKLRAQIHFDEKQGGKLSVLDQTKADVTIAQEAEQQAELGK